MKKTLLSSLLSIIIFTLILGICYPIFIYIIGQISCKDKANGSLIVSHGNIVGSSLIGQYFIDDKYLWGRLSATLDYPYNPLASSGSNLAASNLQLINRINNDLHNIYNDASTPLELVTTSGSGLDPHISTQAAYFQIQRIANARKISKDMVRQIIDRHTTRYQLFDKISVVNTLLVNIDLDQIK